MKNASLGKKHLQTVGSPFKKETVEDMRALHDDIWEDYFVEKGYKARENQVATKHRLRQSSITDL